MGNKLEEFFNNNDFDILEPHMGHEDRFLKKLEENKKPKPGISWKWLSVAASLLILLGLGLSKEMAQEEYSLSSFSEEMKDTETYFVSTINFEIKELEKNRNIHTEEIVENALNQLKNLEDDYQTLIKELKANGSQRQLISAMIQNYQQRIEILQNTLDQIEQIKNKNISEYENYI